MGNSGSASETAGVKAQAEGSMKPIYSLLDLNGKMMILMVKFRFKW